MTVSQVGIAAQAALRQAYSRVGDLLVENNQLRVDLDHAKFQANDVQAQNASIGSWPDAKARETSNVEIVEEVKQLRERLARMHNADEVIAENERLRGQLSLIKTERDAIARRMDEISDDAFDARAAVFKAQDAMRKMENDSTALEVSRQRVIELEDQLKMAAAGAIGMQDRIVDLQRKLEAAHVKKLRRENKSKRRSK